MKQVFSKKLIPPVIKWSGSKRPIAHKLAMLLPESNRFFDPFVGGGAILPFFQRKPAIVGDIIPELIALWTLIKNEPDKVITGYKDRWVRLQDGGYKIYYQIRDSFNETKNPIDFIFLSRTCVNGLIRYNKDGKFNNSLHHTRPGIHPERLAKIIRDWSEWVQNTTFYNQDYRITLSGIKRGDTVFFDPPYVGTRARYVPQSFDYDVFYSELEKLNNLGVNWILTLDGEAGDRSYDNKIPQHLYQTHFKLSTGKSPFSKVMNNKQDKILESVYLNFEPPTEVSSSITQEAPQPLSLFT